MDSLKEGQSTGRPILKRSELLKKGNGWVRGNGSLFLRCHPGFERSLYDEAKKNLAKLLDDEEFTDFSIVTASGKELKVAPFARVLFGGIPTIWAILKLFLMDSKRAGNCLFLIE